MLVDVSGIWEGTLETETAPGYSVFAAYDALFKTYVGSPGPKYRDAVTLTIDSQGPYFRSPLNTRVSRITGEMETEYDAHFLLAGFVDDTGLVKVLEYQSASESAFTGQLSARGGLRDLAGTWASSSGIPGQNLVTYRFGTLVARKFARELRDRVYGSESRHVF
jgi:hypothetical protein